MNPIVFRDLPAVTAIERQLELHARDRLLDDELEELPIRIDEASITLFGIRQADTYYDRLPERVRAQFNRAEWNRHFDVLGQFSRDPNALWHRFGLDLRCAKGDRLHCLEVFGRQLVCALNGLHPQAMLAFAEEAQAEAA